MPGDFICSDTFKNPRRVRFEETAKRSLRGVLAVVLSLLAVVPVVPLMGACLGWAERGRIKRENNGGAAVAWAAVALGLLVTAGQAATLWGGLRSRADTQSLVERALSEGQHGDVAGFTAAFAPGATDDVDPRLTASFHKMLEHRYGKFVGASCDAPLAGVPFLDKGQSRYGYTVKFADATLRLQAAVNPSAVSDLWTASPRRLESLVIVDPEVGEIPFPPPASATRRAAASATAGVDTDH